MNKVHEDIEDVTQMTTSKSWMFPFYSGKCGLNPAEIPWCNFQISIYFFKSVNTQGASKDAEK